MKLINLNVGRVDSRTRLSAIVIWEETARAPGTVFFDIPGEFAEGLRSTSVTNAFLVAACLPAAEAGERRLAIEGEMCPRLHAGLVTVLNVFQHWYGGTGGSLQIEGVKAARSDAPGRPARAGCFFTGGIDSLATLRRNRLLFSETYPEWFRDAVMVYGINFDSDDSEVTFARAVRELSGVARASKIDLVTVQTNVRRILNPDLEFFLYKYHAALLAATAHALSARLTTMSIASTDDITSLTPWGSHPLIDPQYSSLDMYVRHDGLELSRFAKTRLIADWEDGLHNIKVCTANWPGRNCGTCEKCVRTMLALAALGALEKSDAFEAADISEAEVRKIRITTRIQDSFYSELLAPLREAGRHDLARGVDFILTRYRGELGLRGKLKRFDRVYCGGSLRALRQRRRQKAAHAALDGAPR